MKEIVGNLWDYHKQGCWVVITTNGTVKTNGEAVMGRGIALQAKERFPGLSYDLGQEILKLGNILHYWGQEGLLFFPVKHNWWEKADISLIERSAEQLRDFFDATIKDYPVPVCLVRPGCGNGQLDWKDVRPVLEKYLDDRFVIVQW